MLLALNITMLATYGGMMVQRLKTFNLSAGKLTAWAQDPSIVQQGGLPFLAPALTVRKLANESRLIDTTSVGR